MASLSQMIMVVVSCISCHSMHSMTLSSSSTTNVNHNLTKCGLAHLLLLLALDDLVIKLDEKCILVLAIVILLLSDQQVNHDINHLEHLVETKLLAPDCQLDVVRPRRIRCVTGSPADAMLDVSSYALRAFSAAAFLASSVLNSAM